MKNTFWSATPLLAVAVLIFAGRAPAQAERRAAGKEGAEEVQASYAGRLITVLNPAVASKMAERVPLAPRLETIDGKTIYMVDINWGGPEAAHSVFEEVQNWFAANMPGVKTVIRRKRGSYDSDDPGLWKEISDNKGDGVIVGISG